MFFFFFYGRKILYYNIKNALDALYVNGFFFFVTLKPDHFNLDKVSEREHILY